jgi:hypothetical protein
MTADVSTIAALLAKAERTDNPHEAEAYLAKAQQLATLRSVDLAMVRARNARARRRVTPVSRTVQIGEPGKRANTHLVSLFVAVARANDVVIDVARNSTYVIGYGMPTDLDLVEQLWASLAHQMVEAAARYLDGGTWRSQTYRSIGRQQVGRWSAPVVEFRPHTSQTARAAFYRGFVERIGARLQQARQDALREATGPADSDEVPDRRGVAADDGVNANGPSAALVLAHKADEVQSFYRQESRARGSWSGYRGAAAGDTGAATGAGRRAATQARLTSPRGIEGPGPALESGG